VTFYSGDHFTDGSLVGEEQVGIAPSFWVNRGVRSFNLLLIAYRKYRPPHDLYLYCKTGEVEESNPPICSFRLDSIVVEYDDGESLYLINPNSPQIFLIRSDPYVFENVITREGSFTIVMEGASISCNDGESRFRDAVRHYSRMESGSMTFIDYIIGF